MSLHKYGFQKECGILRIHRSVINVGSLYCSGRIHCYLEYLKGRSVLEDKGVDGRMMINWILKKGSCLSELD